MKAEIGENIEIAAEILKMGGLVAVPTETVYGLAANALNNSAVAAIFEAKNRPTFDPLIVHLKSVSEIEKYATINSKKLLKLISHFSPGPITFLLPKKNNIPDLVTSGLDKVALRIPSHPVMNALLTVLDFPLAAPSANPFGYISPTTAKHVLDQLGGKIDYILDGGSCSVGLESTIVGEEENKIVVYRKGGISVEEIEDVMNEKVIVIAHSDSNPAAPGMLKKHYSPNKNIYLENTSINIPFEKTGFLGFSTFHPEVDKKYQFLLSEKADLKEAAQRLFVGLRWLDEQKIDNIIIQLLPEHGLGEAINDRLRRAAAE